MNQVEIAQFRQMLTDVLATHTAEIDGKFELIKLELAQIKEQTTKTNGTVLKQGNSIIALEKANIAHIAHCPLDGRLKVVESDVSARKSIWRFVVIASGAIVSFALFVIAVMSYFSKAKV